MANGADGSITITTALDNTGFQRGSQKLKLAVDSIINKVNKTGKQMSDAYERIVPVISNVSRAVKENDNAMSSSTFGKYLGSVETQATALATQIGKLGDSAAQGFSKAAQVDKFKAGIEKAKDSLTQMQAYLQQIGQQNVSNPAFEKLEADAEKTYARLTALEARQQTMEALGVKKKSSSWRRVQYEIEQAEKLLEQYSARSESMMDNGTAIGSGANTDAYKQIAASLDVMSQALAHYEQLAANFNTIEQPANASTSALKGVDKELKQKQVDAKDARSAFQIFGSALKDTARVAMSLVGGLAKVGFAPIKAGAKAASTALSGVVAGTRKAAAGLLGFTKSSSRAGMSSRGLAKQLTGLRRMLTSRVKYMFINEIFKGMQAGVQSLARYSKSFNAAMSSMKNSMKGLSGNISVAFGGLVSAVAPAITTIINLLSTAMTYVNAFFALLSGKSTVTVAKKGTDDYAKSLKGAAGAAKDLKNQVFGFDELNKEQDKDAGGGGGAAGGKIEYEDKAIGSVLPESIMSYFTSIKEALAAGNWEEVGTLIASGLNTAIDAVDGWIATLDVKAVEWATNIARTLNGLFAGLNWSNLGSTIADGFNVVLHVLEATLQTLDFAQIGRGIAQAIGGFVTTLDFNAIGSTIANGFNAIFHAAEAATQALDFAQIGRNIAQAISSFVTTLDFTAIGNTINNLMLGVMQGAYAFCSGLDWKSIGASVAHILDGIDIVAWLSTAGQLISSGIIALYDTITGFLQTVDWASLGTEVWNGIMALITSIDYAGIASAAYEYLGSAFGAAASFVAGLGLNIWASIQAAWEATKSYFQGYFDQYGGNIIAGLCAGIVNAILGIGEWIKTNILNPFLEGFKSAFGIHSPSTVMEEMGGYLIDGLLNGITNAFGAIVAWFSSAVKSIKDTLSKAWTVIKNTATTAWTKIKTTVTGKFDDLKKGIATTVGNIKTALSDAWEAVKKTASTAWESIKTTISGVADDIKTALSDAWDSVKETASKAWDSVKETASTAWESVKTTVSSVADGIKTTLSNAWDSVKETASAAWNGVKETASAAWEGIKTTISGVADSIKTALSNAWDSVKETASAAWDSVKETASTAWEGINTTVSGVANSIKTALSGTWDSVKETASTAWSSVRTTITGAFSGAVSTVRSSLETLKTTMSNAWNSVSSKASSMWSSITSTISDAISTISGKSVNVGVNIATGVVNGVKNTANKVTNAVSNLASSAINAAKKVLKINSPSKVFTEIGEYMMQGWGNGVEGGERSVIKSVGDVARSVVGEMSNSPTPTLEYAADGLVHGLDFAVDRLDHIVNSFIAIGNILTSIGGLPIPNIAAGTVIPFRTKIADASGEGTTYTAQFADKAEGIEAYTSSIYDVLLELLEIVRRLKLSVDVDALTEAITNRQREVEQIYGGA